MWTVGIRSSATTSEHRTREALVASALLAIVATRGVSAAEPPVTVEYQSAFVGYRHFDAQAPTVHWRQANDDVRDASQSAVDDMPDMQVPPSSSDSIRPPGEREPSPATPDEHREHRQ